MAESFLAGLLTAGFVNIAKDKLASAIAERANLLGNFGDDMENMMDVLESITAVLQDAERQSVNIEVVRLWLKRLKRASVDISDMLEDYKDTSDQLTPKMVGGLKCLPIARKKIAMATRMKNMKEELRKIMNDVANFNFRMGVNSTSVELTYDARETASYLPEQPTGRNTEKQEIINLLSTGTNNDETKIVAIYGLGGMGKSTLAQLVYNDAQFKKYDHRIWVYVSQDFSLNKIGSSVISQLQPRQGQQNTQQQIDHFLHNLLRGKKVLIVLDDLWEEKITELDKLKRLFHVKGSMIDVIVTTRNEGIATKVSTMTPFKLQPLKDNACWEIIKRTSKFEHMHNQEQLKQIGLDIAKKCGGMALAAQAVGYMLQNKNLIEWTNINSSDIWNESSEDGTVLPSLKLSYERMPPQLRICFSYCAIFPKGHHISEDNLINQWIALGFIKPSMGKEYIRQLLGMSFLQVSKLSLTSGEQTVRYIMNDLVHDLARLIISDELFICFVTSRSRKENCRYAALRRYYNDEMKLSNILPSKMRALHFSEIDELNLGDISFAKYLHILDFSGCSSILLPSSIGQLKQLKFLSAPGMQNERFPEYITGLSKLQYLNLNGSSKISALPESTGKLARCLKYLCLSGCSGMSKLPESFGDLKCMVHLDLSGCSGIRKLTDSFGNLTNLQHLDLSGCSSIAKLPDSFGNLTNLQHLELSECSGLRAIPESLCGLKQLQHFNLSCCRYIAQLPEAIGSLASLQYLNMSRCGVRVLPESFKGLHSLLHLDLKYSYIEKGLPGALLGLTALQYLDMSEYMAENFEKEDLPVAMRNLTNLKVLDLANSVYELFYVGKDNGYLDFIGDLTNLEHLDLSRNGVLKYLPIGVSGLKSLMLDGCSPELIDQANSLLHYSLTLPLFKVRAEDANNRSNLYLLEHENIGELHIVSLENIKFLEEAQKLQLLNKHNLLGLTLAWTSDAGRHLEDNDLLEQLLPPRSLKNLCLQGYTNPSFPSWFKDISHHLPNLTCIGMVDLHTCTNLPPFGQLPNLERLCLWSSPSVTKIDKGICGGKGAFRRLRELAVGNMQGLKEWNIIYSNEYGEEEFMFPVLDVFQVFCCPSLKLKPCPPKCRECTIAGSDEVISSVQELQTSSHQFKSSPTMSLTITNSRHDRFGLFHHFPALQELRFSVCPNLTSLPEDIQKLSSLQSLVLDMCASISALPEWLSNISSLKRLVIRECTGINSLPPCIQQLTNLQNLVIGDNQELQQWCLSEDNKAKLAHIDIIYE